MKEPFNGKQELKELDNYYPNSDLSHIYLRHRDQIIELLKTIELVWSNKKLESHNFEILYEGLKSSWQVVYFDVLGKEINSMIGVIEGIEQLLMAGINDSKWKVRFNTLVIMKRFKHEEIKKNIIEIALNDKSKKVRKMALDIKKYWKTGSNKITIS
ncbi:hypothetical protein [Tenacibaculum xiamenense]|uniref:hypothetical protein n=1 Tax=Tenacibaculum xiamenense TaxID=1261553 RepID=UPI0038943C26